MSGGNRTPEGEVPNSSSLHLRALPSVAPDEEHSLDQSLGITKSQRWELNLGDPSLTGIVYSNCRNCFVTIHSSEETRRIDLWSLKDSIPTLIESIPIDGNIEDYSSVPNEGIFAIERNDGFVEVYRIQAEGESFRLSSELYKKPRKSQAA